MSQVQLTDNMRLLTTQEPCEGKAKTTKRKAIQKFIAFHVA